MSELAGAIIVAVPLLLLAHMALHLLRLGITAGELTESARQRLAGVGMLLLWVVVLACLGVLWVGLWLVTRH